MAQDKHRSMRVIELGGGLVKTELMAKNIAASYVESSRGVTLADSDDVVVKVERLTNSWLVQTRFSEGISIDRGENAPEIFFVEIGIMDGRILRYEVGNE